MQLLKGVSTASLALISTGAFAQSEWISQASETKASFKSVLWNGTQLVASGDELLTSLEGKKWISQKQSVSISASSITPGSHGFVAVGTGVAIGFPRPQNLLKSSASSCCVGSPVDMPVVFASTDGLVWSTYYTWFQGLLKAAAVSDVGRWAAVAGTGVIITSPDGETWDRASGGANLANNSLSSIVWSDNQFVTVGAGGVIMTSPNGVDWNLQVSGTTESLLSVVWCGSQFVAVGSNGMILTSPNGVDWAWRTSGTEKTFRSVIWCGSEFVAVGDGGLILTSPDGLEWTLRASGTEMNLNSVVWMGSTGSPQAGGQYVAVGDSGTILTSQLDQAELPTAIQPFSNSSAKLSLHLTPSTLLVDLPNSMMGKQIRATIYTVMGNKVTSVRASGLDHQVSMPLAGMAPGLYLFEAVGSDKRVVQSFNLLR